MFSIYPLYAKRKDFMPEPFHINADEIENGYRITIPEMPGVEGFCVSTDQIMETGMYLKEQARHCPLCVISITPDLQQFPEKITRR